MTKGLSQYDELFGQHVRQRRSFFRLSMKELAERVGVQQSYISRIETGKRSLNPEKGVFKKIAAELNITDREISEIKRGELPSWRPSQAITDFRSASVIVDVQILLTPEIAAAFLNHASLKGVDPQVILAQMIAKKFAHS